MPNATRSSRREWLVPTGLVLLAAVPVVAGSVRLLELASGPEVTSANARFVAAPLPVVVHILTATLFSLLGAFQIPAGFRRRHRRWHRRAGCLLVPCGLAAALTGLWMTATYDLPATDGDLLAAFRWIFGSGMVAAIVLGVAALRRHAYGTHGAWMLRAYAIGMGAGTQVFTHVPWLLLFGPPDALTRALLMAAGWTINLVVAEWVIRRRSSRRPSATGAVSESGGAIMGPAGAAAR